MYVLYSHPQDSEDPVCLACHVRPHPILPFSPQLSTSLAPPFVSSNIKLTESLKMLSFLFESPLLNFLVTQIFVIL